MSGAIHRFSVRVYYEDTDFSGVVYHAGYLRFLERGRPEMLRDLGVDQASLFGAEPPLGFAVARMEIDFRRPARMDDLLAKKQETMKQQFTAMEQAIQNSSSQGQWLSGQLAALNNNR